MKNRFIRLLCVIIILVLAACSSLTQTLEVTEKRNKAVEYATFGNDYYSKGLYVKALEFFNLALAYNGGIYYEAGMIESLNSIGKSFVALNQPVEAKEAFDKAYILAKMIDEPRFLAQCAINIGEFYMATKEVDKALELFNQALGYSERGIPPKDKAVIFHNLGTISKRKGEPEAALEYYASAVKLNEANKNYAELASNEYMTASIYSDQGDYETAFIHANQALKHDKYVENSLGIAKDYYALGVLSLKNNKKEDAFEYFTKSLFVYNSLEVIFPGYSSRADKLKILNYLVSLGEELEKTEEVEYYKKLLE